MSLPNLLGDHQRLLIQQCLSVPFGLLFYFLAKYDYLSLKNRYLYLCVGGSVLAVITMGIYSTLLFTPIFIFVGLVCTVDHCYIHTLVFGMQMLWQTIWHIFLQYKEVYEPESVSSRLLLAVSSLMLITQRITSVSLDIQDKRLTVSFNKLSRNESCKVLLPIISYILNFTTLLGGPLCTYHHFVSFNEGISVNPPPNPLGIVNRKLMQVFLLEALRYSLLYMVRANHNLNAACGVVSIWMIAMVIRLHYYSHWRVSECLNNAAGLGFCGSKSCHSKWSGLSDGHFWEIESSISVSVFTRRWNATTSSWLRRLVFQRSKHFPFLLTFGFSLWWHGLHMGHCIGFPMWAVAVKADQYICRYLSPKVSSAWGKAIYVYFSWMNTQIIITCIVITTELTIVRF